MTVDDVIGVDGDPSRGRARFAAACATCHRTADGGADIGPDLAAIDQKFDRRGLIDAIVHPGAAIAFGYAAELFATADGSDHIGFLQADGTTLAIRDGYGRPIAIARASLAARVPLAPSLMPEPLDLALTERDVADIAAYLMKEKP
jgi:putative heme-binding domain-containing protein